MWHFPSTAAAAGTKDVGCAQYASAMTSRVEIDLPDEHSTLPFGELASFVEHARNAGATSDTPITPVAAEQDPSILIALRVELDEPTSQPADLRIKRADIKELIDLLTDIEDNDGDARSQLQLHLVRDLRQRLTHIALQP